MALRLLQALPSKPDWYKANDDDDPTLQPAKEAFRIAVDKFSTVLTKDQKKVVLVNQTSAIQDLQALVQNLQAGYDAKKEKKPVQKWLRKFSKRVTHYGYILDVLVQHHPEYVSLAWGAMKFLFVGVTNHEALTACLAEGLVHIADSLPGVEVATILFPTERMKEALAEIYANIIRFLVRAHDWFEEGSLMRAVHSVTRPKELRYDDLLEEIDNSTATLRRLAVTASQAEQRDMHLLLLEMKQLMIAHQQINSSAHLKADLALSDLQFSNILTYLSNIPLSDPDKTLERAVAMRNWNRRKTQSVVDPFWLRPHFRAWSEALTSSIIVIEGKFRSQHNMRDFLTSAVECIRESKIPVLWAMGRSSLAGSAGLSVQDLIKYLVHQALQYGRGPPQRSAALSCAQFQTAREPAEWTEILAASLIDLRHVYIAVDMELLWNEESTWEEGGARLVRGFESLIALLAVKSPETVVKVVLVNYGAKPVGSLSAPNLGYVIQAGRSSALGGRSAGPPIRRLAARTQIKRGLARGIKV